MPAVRERYFGTSAPRVQPLPDRVPVSVMFLTDGVPSDRTVASEQIRSASHEPVFRQFMGMGAPRQFRSLQRLDDLDGWLTDNADFFAVDERDLGHRPISDDDLFERLLTEYPDWLRRARALRLLRG